MGSASHVIDAGEEPTTTMDRKKYWIQTNPTTIRVCADCNLANMRSVGAQSVMHLNVLEISTSSAAAHCSVPTLTNLKLT